ncbi:MAG TPA: tRNA (N6-threonylcarbamoyladenosine(37)-N6)-methyltransferase TrmO [Desulfobacteraceae bacterium]|nr:tRNA (N6-threonylcarbamoyladenosine(37)-N6)-methyltransferase TrmO [Deltaproteobacteria bacterium]RLB95910.1 MAG: tRNA (N6-threonylcarbamoyladenosine(37)-N6)-methyltransferase TrmO [Deltaproteobacteria bacterium]HDI60592.1 tRNA (N6-threonylcarbamoyladenosine(37)-N6)-methyltransferase TrmO [Desulfobacteraceae bacterium]
MLPAEFQSLIIRPVGVVRSPIKRPVLVATEEGLNLTERVDRMRQAHREIRKTISELIFDSTLDGILDGVEGFSHILVLYWPHLVPEDRRRLRQVHPMGRSDLPRQGIFATCSPARPNPVLVSAVKLLARDGQVLKVQGLEAVDGSPIVDIKPYVQSYYGVGEPGVPAWMAQIQREMAEDDECAGGHG